MKASEIRSKWLEFFAGKGHKIEPSASLVPHNDPSLLWINAGMAPLKPYFDGRVKPENPRLANSQKCIRTNDIENVGKTRRHHTFLRCWAISPSATISRKRRSPGPGNS